MPRMTHAQLIEAAKLKLEELQAKAEEKQQSEREKLTEKREALITLISGKDETFNAKIEELVKTHKAAQQKRLDKLNEIDLELGATAPDDVSVEA